MTNTKLITTLIVEDKMLQKNDQKVRLPFGCEYSIYLKNLENRKVSIGITIDGQDILNGSKLLLNPKEDMTLERFIEKLTDGRKLRFIEKTKQISEFRGNKAEDGLIIISYQYEKEKINHGLNISNIFDGYGVGLRGGIQSDSLHACTNSIDASYSSNNLDATLATKGLNDKGITVEGSESKQSFNKGYIGQLEIKENIEVIELFGYVSECGISPDKETVFIKSKFCPSCGAFYEGENDNDYCSKDGTYLKQINSIEDVVTVSKTYPTFINTHLHKN